MPIVSQGRAGVKARCAALGLREPDAVAGECQVSQHGLSGIGASQAARYNRFQMQLTLVQGGTKCLTVHEPFRGS